MPRPAQIPPPARRESQVAARARLRQSAAAGVGAAGLARGAPASAAASQLAHSASAAAAHPLPDSVRPGAGREPPGRLMGAALRAVADSRAGSAPGLAGARTQAEGGGPPPEVGRRGEPPASPLDGGSVEKPERSGDTSPPPPPQRLGSGDPPRGRSACGQVPCAGGRDALPSRLGTTPPARGLSGCRSLPRPISPPSPGLGWVWGSARGSVDPRAGTVQEVEEAWFPGLGGVPPAWGHLGHRLSSL